MEFADFPAGGDVKQGGRHCERLAIQNAGSKDHQVGTMIPGDGDGVLGLCWRR